MAKFIAIHPVDPPVPFPSEGFEAVARKCKAGVDLDAYWVRSWLQLNDKGEVIKVYCEWDGKDANESHWMHLFLSCHHLRVYFEWLRYWERITGRFLRQKALENFIRYLQCLLTTTA